MFLGDLVFVSSSPSILIFLSFRIGFHAPPVINYSLVSLPQIFENFTFFLATEVVPTGVIRQGVMVVYPNIQ